MRYPMPNFPCDFEIPDDWLAEAGMDTFTPTATAYRSTADAVLVPLHKIEPPNRVKTCLNHWRGFDRTRMISVMKGIATGAEIEAIPVVQLPEIDNRLVPTPLRYHTYCYRVRDGFHRFYASVAAGFENVPATIMTVPELVELAKNLGWCA